MTTLSGHRSSPSVNYYSGDGFTLDLSTAGFAAGSTWTFTVHATSSSCVDQVGYDVYLQRPAPSTEACFHWSTITPSGDPTVSFTYGPKHVGDGVEWGAVSGATGCVDFTRITFAVKSYTYPGACSVEWDWSVTYTGSGGGAPICAYGHGRKPGVTAVAVISIGLIASIGVAAFDPILLPYLGGVMGTALMVDQLCSLDKPVDQVIHEADWGLPSPAGIGTLAQYKLLQNFRNVLWDFFCECIPAPSGSPPPVSPPVTIIQKPSYLTVYAPITIDNTEISTTINELWQYFLSINIGNQNSISIGQQIAECTCTTSKLGTAHPGLSDIGEFPVSGILGLAVFFTTLPNRIGVAEGDPDTLYDVGWINIGTDAGWQTRMRPTTNPWMVFPERMKEMTRVGFSIPPDVVCTISELVPA